jgi:hypothetical protein
MPETITRTHRHDWRKTDIGVCDDFDAAILDVSRVDNINDIARALLAGMSATLRDAGKEGDFCRSGPRGHPNPTR